SIPLAILALEGEQPCAPALAGEPGALCRDVFRGRVGKVTHHLPADRRVGVKQPLDDVHSVLHPPERTAPAQMQTHALTLPGQQVRKYLQTWPKQLTSEQMYDRIERCWGRGALRLTRVSQGSSALCLSTSPDPTFGRTCSTWLKFAIASTS